MFVNWLVALVQCRYKVYFITHPLWVPKSTAKTFMKHVILYCVVVLSKKSFSSSTCSYFVDLTSMFFLFLCLFVIKLS